MARDNAGKIPACHKRTLAFRANLERHKIRITEIFVAIPEQLRTPKSQEYVSDFPNFKFAISCVNLSVFKQRQKENLTING
jgi:hypothetical protein